MSTFDTLIREHYEAINTLRELGGDPEAVCKAVDEAYTESENPFANLMGLTNDEMAISEAYGKIQREIVSRWLAKIPRAVMVTMLNAILPLPYGKITYLPGEAISPKDAMAEWNKVHAGEEAIRLTRRDDWSC